MNVLEFNGIHRAYKKGADVLKGVTFSVGKGEVVGLLGKNGAGKTTLIRIAMGMLEAQQGTVRVFDLDPREKPIEVKKRVGYSPPAGSLTVLPRRSWAGLRGPLSCLAVEVVG